MARPGNRAAARIRSLLTATPGLNTNLENLAQLEKFALSPIHGAQIAMGNLAAEFSERGTRQKYPSISIYCDKLSNLLLEKFRTFSGRVGMVIEVRLSQDNPDGLDAALELYVDAVTQVLDRHRGDWGNGLFYAGGYEVVFGPLKHGGRNFLQVARITFELEASIN